MQSELCSVVRSDMSFKAAKDAFVCHIELPVDACVNQVEVPCIYRFNDFIFLLSILPFFS